MPAEARTASRSSALVRAAEMLFGPAVPSALPERVARDIRVHEERSERLICLAQIAAVAFFALLYASTPRGFGASSRFEPVPLMLAAYSAFLLARYAMAQRGPLSPVVLVWSVIVDVAALMIMIWSFHLQYDQPPSLSLKAPTLLYVFLIIALRALRFDPRWVLLAGGLAALGWALMLAYALAVTPRAAITHSYAEYATTAKLLVGAEIDKIVAIVAFTLLLAIALERARRMLIRAVLEGTAATELSRYFAPDIAASIVGAPERLESGTGVTRQAAIMFIDLRGFTALASTMEPKSLVALLGAYHETVLPIVQRHNGSVITYLGDGIMITFGAVRPSRTSAADACRAAEDLIERLDVWARSRRLEGLPLMRTGLGVSFGPVVVGTIGTEGRLEYATIGDAVNRSARLQGLTKSEGVAALVAGNAWARALEQGFAPRRPFEPRSCSMAGIDGTVEVVALPG